MQLHLGLLALSAIPLVAGHAKITNAKGDLGGEATALGIKAGSSDTDTSDVTVFKGGPFGQTVGGGAIDPEKDTAAAKIGDKLPQVSDGGQVSMTWAAVNGDGGGPADCSVDTAGDGKNFQTMTVSTQVPGNKGLAQDAPKTFPLVADMPKGVKCTGSAGGDNNLCYVQCKNPTGPFGGTVPVQQAAGGAADGAGAANGTANAGNDATPADDKADTAAKADSTKKDDPAAKDDPTAKKGDDKAAKKNDGKAGKKDADGDNDGRKDNPKKRDLAGRAVGVRKVLRM